MTAPKPARRIGSIFDGAPNPISRYARRLARRVGGIYARTWSDGAKDLDGAAVDQARQRCRFGPRAFTTRYLSARQRALDTCRRTVRRFG